MLAGEIKLSISFLHHLKILIAKKIEIDDSVFVTFFFIILLICFVCVCLDLVQSKFPSQCLMISESFCCSSIQINGRWIFGKNQKLLFSIAGYCVSPQIFIKMSFVLRTTYDIFGCCFHVVFSKMNWWLSVSQVALSSA